MNPVSRRPAVADRRAGDLDPDDDRVGRGARHEEAHSLLEHLQVARISQRLLSAFRQRLKALLPTNPIEAQDTPVDLDAAFDLRESELAVDVRRYVLCPFTGLRQLVGSVEVREPDEGDHCILLFVESVSSTADDRIGGLVQSELKRCSRKFLVAPRPLMANGLGSVIGFASRTPSESGTTA